MNEFKDILKMYRNRFNLSQAELAQKLNLSASTISMYEVGARQPNFETEEKIADFFNIDLNTLRGKDYELTPDEQKIIDFFRSFTTEGQSKMFEFLEFLSTKYSK